MGLDKFKSEYYSKFSTSSITILEEVVNNKNYIIVNTEFGICKVRKQHLLSGHVPTIQSAINKNDYFINKANNTHNNLYSYNLVEYSKSHSKVKIICKIHGMFMQAPNVHLFRQGCPKCGDKSCSDHHSSNPTGWSKTNWKDAAKKSKRFESFKIYIIKCWNDQETFYKIGRTFVDIKRRFQSKTEMPYNHTILKIIEGDSNDIYDLEIKLKNMNKDNKYTPLLKFNGSKECFNNVIQIW
jgi:hypothetical protein